MQEDAAVTPPVSYLFVPGNRPDRFDKARASGADAIIIDLEDAVIADDKAAAREHIAAWMRASMTAAAGAADVLVRVNDASTPWFDADLALLREAGVRGVMLPKAEHAAHVNRVREAVAGAFVIPIIESARGLVEVESIAAAASVQRLAFGTLDYAVDLDLSGDERGLAYPACRNRDRVARGGIDVAGRRSHHQSQRRGGAPCRRGLCARLRFGAKLCIHPRQVAALHAAMAPRPEEIAWGETDRRRGGDRGGSGPGRRQDGRSARSAESAGHSCACP